MLVDQALALTTGSLAPRRDAKSIVGFVQCCNPMGQHHLRHPVLLSDMLHPPTGDNLIARQHLLDLVMAQARQRIGERGTVDGNELKAVRRPLRRHQPNAFNVRNDMLVCLDDGLVQKVLRTARITRPAADFEGQLAPGVEVKHLAPIWLTRCIQHIELVIAVDLTNDDHIFQTPIAAFEVQST